MSYIDYAVKKGFKIKQQYKRINTEHSVLIVDCDIKFKTKMLSYGAKMITNKEKLKKCKGDIGEVREKTRYEENMTILKKLRDLSKAIRKHYGMRYKEVITEAPEATTKLKRGLTKERFSGM